MRVSKADQQRQRTIEGPLLAPHQQILHSQPQDEELDTGDDKQAN